MLMTSTGRWEELFAARKWRVAEEITGQAEVPAGNGQPAIRATFTRGEFEIAPPGAYRSPLSTNLGRYGSVLQETDQGGGTDIPGSRIAVGAGAVRKAREQYGAIW
jgi:hypothetical protein